MNQQQLEFNQGIMKLSAYDPLSKQYETRILRLPEVPFLESLEHLINNETNKPLRTTKSCNNKRLNNTSVTLAPRRCQSNPNLSKNNKQQPYQKKNNNAPSSIRSKRSLSSAFNAVAGFIQKAAKHKKQKSFTSTTWPNETWYDEIRISSDSSISTLNLNTPSYPARQTIALSCENWWKSSPPLVV